MLVFLLVSISTSLSLFSIFKLVGTRFIKNKLTKVTAVINHSTALIKLNVTTVQLVSQLIKPMNAMN